MRHALLLSFGFLLIAGSAARAEAPARIPNLKPVMTKYDVYVGGFHFVTANILFQAQNKKYHTRVEGSTRGFWNGVVPWNATLEAEGSIQRDRFVPSEFRTRDVWDKKPKDTKLYFDKKGDIRTEFEPPRSEDREPVTVEQKRGALDPVTALLQMLGHIATQEDCDIKVPVFDGKRRFDLDGSDRGMAHIDEEGYGVYKGPARACDVNFTMVAGEWRDQKKNRFWQNEKGENAREPFHVWLASSASDLPELPVRLETDSAWGLIVIHLADWHYATKSELKAKLIKSAAQLPKTADQ